MLINVNVTIVYIRMYGWFMNVQMKTSTNSSNKANVLCIEENGRIVGECGLVVIRGSYRVACSLLPALCLLVRLVE